MLLMQGKLTVSPSYGLYIRRREKAEMYLDHISLLLLGRTR